MSEGNRGNGPEGQAPPTGESTAIRPGDARPTANSTPPASGQGAETPVWDPPPPAKPRTSLRDRFGLGKKADQEESNPLVPPMKSAQPADGKPADSAAPTNQQPAAGQPGTGTPAAGAKSGNKPAQANKSAPENQAANKPAAAPNRAAAGGATAAAGTSGANPARAAQPAPNQPAPNQGAANQGAANQAGQQEQSRWQRPATGSGNGAAGPGNGAAGSGKGAGAKDGSADQTSVIPAVAATGAAGTAAAGASAGSSTAAPAAGTAKPAAETVKSDVLETETKAKAGQARRTRKARLRLSRVDPWSVMKTSFLFSIAAGIMMVVAVYVVWTVIGSSGLFDSINEMVQNVVSTPGDTTPFQIEQYINTPKVMGVTALLACVDVVIFTALATLGSFLYNLAATMLGGLEVTLAED